MILTEKRREVAFRREAVKKMEQQEARPVKLGCQHPWMGVGAKARADEQRMVGFSIY